MRCINLLLVGLLLLGLSCQHEDEELKCGRYFLTNASGPGEIHSKFLYNADGLLSSITPVHGGGLVVRYDQNKHIKEIYDISLQQVTHEFFVETSGRLTAVIRYVDNSRYDSMAFEYDGQNRLSKRSIFNISSPLALLDSYYSVEYPLENTAKFDFYKSIMFKDDTFEYTGSFVYTMDDKKRPYPEEYYALWLSWTNTILPHNMLSLKILDKNGNETSNSTYQYTYNSDGYPMQQGLGSESIEFEYACEPPLE